MKLSKLAAANHNRAMDLVRSDKSLTYAEREFILDHYQESAGQRNSLVGAFFTPGALARDFSIEVSGGRIIDLCAGIGRLSYACREQARELVCIERCAEYVEVGRRVLPEASWIQGDVFDEALYHDLGTFDWAISNPPFGRIKADGYSGRYGGSECEFRVIEMASRVARFGTFIIPQESAPFRYSGRQGFRSLEPEEYPSKLRRFVEDTGIELDHNCGIDTALHRDAWHGVAPICEIVLCAFPRQVPDVIDREVSQGDLFADVA